MDPISIHFHEIALKGKNRSTFERRLQQNLATAIAPLGRLKVQRFQGGLLVEGESDQRDEILRRATEVCGVSHAMPVVRVADDLEAVAKVVINAIAQQKPRNWRISAKRRDKTYPTPSDKVNQLVGKMVSDATGLPVKLQGAELEAFVLLLRDQILVGTEKRKGVGGLPVGSAGRVTALLSGGIDSPVAAWRMMKRGCRVEFVHFHSYPRVDRTTIEKAEDLVEQLTRWQYRSRLHLVPLLEIQTAVRMLAPEELRVVLYRRFMLRLAQKIAYRRGGRALVTGESVGQVASQTLQNIASVNAVATLPVLRPLIGMDKQEIIDQAQAIGTFEISIQPDQDCCQLFLPPHPTVSSNVQQCLEAEAKMDVDALVADALARTEVREFRWPKPLTMTDGEAATVG